MGLAYRRSILPSLRLVLLVVVVASAGLGVTNADKFTIKWFPNINYTDWEKNNTVHVGDWLGNLNFCNFSLWKSTTLLVFVWIFKFFIFFFNVLSKGQECLLDMKGGLGRYLNNCLFIKYELRIFLSLLILFKLIKSITFKKRLIIFFSWELDHY